MSDQFPYSDIVLLALVAGFVLLRLRAVLGQKIGQDVPPFPGLPRGEDLAPVVQIASPGLPAPDADAELLKSLDAASENAIANIKKADAQFTLVRFLDGARGAFEMVFDAFLKGDAETLKMLLAPSLFEMFAGELERRKTAEARRETTLVSIVSAELANAALEKSLARLRVRFVSEQITVERDRDNKIIAGDASKPEHVQDEWLFERDITSRNPNWKIIET